MLEKKINPLRRGRMQGKANEKQKKSSVGEITDPFSVLNDSISSKGRSENSDKDDYIPSEKVHQEIKTTTVDALDPLLDPAEAPIRAKEEIRNCRNNRCHNAPRESPRSRPEHYSHDRKGKFSNAPRQPLESRQDHCSCDGSPKCVIKHFFCKILRFLGFKSSCKSSCCSSQNTDEISNSKHKTSSERHDMRNGARGGNRNYNRPRRPSPKKFQ